MLHVNLLVMEEACESKIVVSRVYFVRTHVVNGYIANELAT